MEIRLEKIRNINVVHIAGNIDMFAAKELKEFLLSFQLSSNNNKFILNLNNIHHIDSSGIASLINFNLALQKEGIRLRLVTGKKHLQLLHYFQLDTSMSLHQSLESALDSFL